MLLRLLAWLSAVIIAHPWRVVITTTVPCLLAGAYGATVPADLSFTGIMDRSNPEVGRYFDTARRLHLGGLLPLLLEGPEDALDDAATRLVPLLEDLPQVRRVDYAAPTSWLEEHALYLVDDETFDLWLGLATHPDDAKGAEELATRLKAIQDEVARLRPEGSRLLMIVLDKDPLDFDAGGADYFRLEEATTAVLEPLGIQGTYAGLAAMAAQDQKNTLGRVRILTPVSLLLVLLLFRLVETSVLRLLLVSAPMLLTVVTTLGLTGAVLGNITVLETFFGIMVFGLGIDFALHLMVRMREERWRGLTFPEAMRRTLVGSGRGVIAGALTTTGAFSIIALAPDPMARHLGVSGGIGLLVCLVLMLTLLPAAWALFERSTHQAHVVPAEVHLPVVRALALHAARHPRLHVGLACALLAVALAGVPRLTIETDLSRVFNRQVPAVAAMHRLQERFALNSSPWITARPTLEEAREVGEQLKALDVIGTVESAAVLLPAGGPERHRRLQAAAGEVDAQRKTYAALLPLTTDEEAERLRQADKLLEVLEKGAALAPPTPDDLPPSLKERLVGPQGEFLIYAYVTSPTLDGTVASKERAAVQAVAPDATGFPALIEAVMAGDRPWALPVFFGILAFVGLVLAFDMRQGRMVILALTPVLIGTGVTFGVLCWAGYAFNVLSTLVVPLIIGLGVDDGIHVVHRLKEDRTLPPEVGAASVGKAIVMTTATTCISFVALLFTDHPGMEGMAVIMLIGLPLCLLASVTTLPALAHLLGVNRPAAPGAGPPGSP